MLNFQVKTFHLCDEKMHQMLFLTGERQIDFSLKHRRIKRSPANLAVTSGIWNCGGKVKKIIIMTNVTYISNGVLFFLLSWKCVLISKSWHKFWFKEYLQLAD